MSNVKEKLAQLSMKKRSVGKVMLSEDIAEALEYIEKRAEVKKAVLIEDALKRYNVKKIAADLKKEIEQQ